MPAPIPCTSGVTDYVQEVQRVVRCYQMAGRDGPLPVRVRANELSAYEQMMLR